MSWKNNVTDFNGLFEEDQINLVRIKKSFENLINQTDAIESEKGINTFGFGYPLLIRRDVSDNKLTVAPLLIWSLRIKRTSDFNTWVIQRNEDDPIYFNEILINHLQSDADVKVDQISSEMKDDDFLPYESMFKKVHKELREGKRQLFSYENADKNLKVGSFYVLNGVLLFLEDVNIETENVSLPTGGRLRKDGRTRIIFENGTMSNMLYRSLDKALLNNVNDGKIVSHSAIEIENELFNNVNSVNEEDLETGWIYILKSKSTHKDISSLKDLYKIGYSTVPVPQRILNASKEPTYLMADVKIVESYKTYNLNAQKFEHLIHRFFAEVCLNVDIMMIKEEG